jgi:transcriptional regulator with XRE-family HTH domain
MHWHPCKAFGWQAEFAKRHGLTRSKVSRLARGRIHPRYLPGPAELLAAAPARLCIEDVLSPGWP